MNKELIINSTASETDIVLLEDKKLVELHKDKKDKSFCVGDIYFGRVRKVVNGLNAAFVDIGSERDAFMQFLDHSMKLLSFIKYTKGAVNAKVSPSLADQTIYDDKKFKGEKIANYIKANQLMLVQVIKEPISTKGPRISGEVTLAGRYLVLVPFSNKISISHRIKEEEERARLKRLLLSIKPQNFGVIVRTAAQNKLVADLDTDLKNLYNKWKECVKELTHAKPPKRIMGELDLTTTILRDLLSESFNNIHVNDPTLYSDVREYLKTIAPNKVDIVKLYKGREPIFDHFHVEKQIKGAFGKTVTTRSGAYLVIEHTEALHVIDINSGNRTKSHNDQETNAIEVNLETAEEVARQLRLRDMGGIIVVDFIDMHDPANKRKLYQELKKFMKNDRAKHTILPVNKFGLIQITRQRVRPELKVNTVEKCPTCDGSGEIRSSVLLIDDIENNIKYLIQEQNQNQLILTVHPYIHAYLTKGLLSVQLKWYFKFHKWIRIRPMSSNHFMEFSFFDKNFEEIVL